MPRLAKRFGLFGRAAAYRIFWCARTVSLFGDTVANVALVLFVARNATRGISPGMAVGLLLLVQVVPRLLGPFAGTLADLVDQRRLMAWCDGCQALLFGGIAIFLRSGAGGYGLLSSVYGVGMVLAPLLLLRWKRGRVTTLLLLLGIFLDGLGTLLTGLAPVLLLAAFAQLLAGRGNGFENVSNNALIQETVPRRMLGRVFGTVGNSTYIASGVAYVVGGSLLTVLSARAIFVLAGAGVLIVCLLLWIILPRSLDEYRIQV